VKGEWLLQDEYQQWRAAASLDQGRAVRWQHRRPTPWQSGGRSKRVTELELRTAAACAAAYPVGYGHQWGTGPLALGAADQPLIPHLLAQHPEYLAYG
jgi:hypothetical protein